MKLLILLLLLFSYKNLLAQKMNNHFLQHLLQTNHTLFDTVLNSADHKQVQILYTKINRDKHNIPHFTSYGYRINPQWYFYPASTVKLPTVIFALEKINRLHIAGLTKESVMFTDSAYANQIKITQDTTAKNGLPSVEQYVKRRLLTSDNDAYNRLYEFVGRAEINAQLKANGIADSRILNRLAVGDKGESAKHTNPINFYNNGKIIYRQAAQYDAKEYPLPLQNLLRGKGYLNDKDSLVMQPFSFENKNVYTIQSQQWILKKLLFPEAFKQEERFTLTDDDYQLVYKYLSMYCTESDYPKYGAPEFFPTYNKMLFLGRDTNAILNNDVRIFNKYGDSYGYIIDNACIADFKNNIEFLLTAVVQSNNNEIYNDDQYEYKTVCYPFMKNIGETIYNYELQRKRKHKPHLSKFKFDYSKE